MRSPNLCLSVRWEKNRSSLVDSISVITFVNENVFTSIETGKFDFSFKKGLNLIWTCAEMLKSPSLVNITPKVVNDTSM